MHLAMGLLSDTQNCGCACAGNARNIFPVTAGKRSRNASRHVRHACAVMHAGIANWRFPLKLVAGENVPGILCACTTCNFTYLVRGPWPAMRSLSVNMIKWSILFTHINWKSVRCNTYLSNNIAGVQKRCDLTYTLICSLAFQLCLIHSGGYQTSTGLIKVFEADDWILTYTFGNVFSDVHIKFENWKWERMMSIISPTILPKILYWSCMKYSSGKHIWKHWDYR